MGSVGRWSSLFSGRRLLVGALALGAAVLVYVFAFSKPKVMYSRRVDELLREWKKFADDEQRMRVDGTLVPGSLFRLASCEHRFRLTANGKEILVRVPVEPDGEGCSKFSDTFCASPGEEPRLTVEGYLAGTAERPSFVAEKVMVKYYRVEDLHCLPIPLVR